MKKLGLLVMPLMAISLLASCNNGGGGGGGEDSPEVTKEEFDHAVNFDGIKRMQVNQKDTSVLGKDAYLTEQKYETSEFICHTVQIQKVGTVESRNESYAKLENIGDEECTEVMRKSETEWYNPTPAESIKYPFTTDFYNPFKNIEAHNKDFEPSLEYSSFDVVDENYVYKGNCKSIYSSEIEVSLSITFSFKNKVLINSFILQDMGEEGNIQSEISYTFEDIVPTWPL